MEEIKVSVLCAAYNHEKYIRSALEGFVIQKTSFKYEVIVHDDASTDKTAEIIREYEQKYPEIVKPIYQSKNQYSQGKEIIQEFMAPKAKGKYIALCEGDDYWTDDTKLQQQYYKMETGDYSLCVHKVCCCNEDNTFNPNVIPSQSYGLTKDCIIRPSDMAKYLYKKEGYPFHTSSFFMKRELFLDANYKTLVSFINGDAAYLRLAMLRDSIYYIDRDMSCRRLMTIGNWNSRFQKSEDKIKINYHLRTIEGEQIFDRISNGAFHENVVYATYVRFLFLLKHFDDASILGEFEKYRTINRFPYKISFKTSIAYYLFKFSPKLYRKIAKMLNQQKSEE